MTFADLMRTAADAGLIDDVKRFLEVQDGSQQDKPYLRLKNTAADVAKVIPDFYKDASFLLEQLRKRNS